jgi:uncharacterized protein YndB with AHSA1/START domain
LTETVLQPVTAGTTVHRGRDVAFQVFTDGIADWWPTNPHSVGGDAVASVVFEGRAGGRVYERWDDGTERQWAEVLVWEPPERLVLRWHPGRAGDEATEVEVVFEAVDANTTKLRLTHIGWERLADGTAIRESYEAGGWSRVLACFVDHTADPVCVRSFAVTANQRVWRLLERGEERSVAETEDMVHAAHASAWHWRRVGEPVNDARAEWLCSHVYTVLGRSEPARHHARRSLELCIEHGIGDFDLAYGHEGVARAAACAGDRDTALRHRALAVEAAAAIVEDEDRAWFDKDLAAGPWFGL